MSSCRQQSGSATLLTLAVLVVAAGLLAGMARLGDAAREAARADAIADVTALAAVVGGRSAAANVARGSGADLLEMEQLDEERSRVVVRLGSSVRVAAARPVHTGGAEHRDLGRG